MQIVPSFLTSSPYLEWPQGLVGWAGWFIFAGVLLYFLYRWRKYNGHWGSKQVLLLVLLALCVPLSSLFMGIKLPASLGLPSPDLPRDFPAPTILILSAIPWMLAAGLLGLNAAAGLAFFAGLLQALWITHNPFTPLEICLLAILFAAAMQQNYRTRIYRAIHHPLIAALCLSVFYPLLSLATTPLVSRGFLASRMDFALTQLGGLSLSMAGALLIGGVFSEIIAASLPQVWGGHAPLVVSPSERSLQARFLYSIAPLAFALLLILLAANWIVAGNTARRLLSNQMANAAKIAAEGVPVYLGTGQTLMSEITKDPALLNGAPDELSGTPREQVLRYSIFQPDLPPGPLGEIPGGVPPILLPHRTGTHRRTGAHPGCLKRATYSSLRPILNRREFIRGYFFRSSSKQSGRRRRAGACRAECFSGKSFCPIHPE